MAGAERPSISSLTMSSVVYLNEFLDRTRSQNHSKNKKSPMHKFSQAKTPHFACHQVRYFSSQRVATILHGMRRGPVTVH